MAARLRALLSPGDGPPLRELAGSVGWYPLGVLVLLNLVDELDRGVMAVFGPNIKRYFGINNATLGAIVGLQVFLVILFAVPIGYAGTKFDRSRILRWSAVAWTAFSFATYFAVQLPLFVLARLGVGIGKASVDPVGKSLLTDYYPPTGWNRVLAIHGAANPMGAILGPVLAGIIGLTMAGDGVWRVAFPLLTVPTVFALVASRRLREPESQMVRTLTGEVLTVTGAPSGLTLRQASTKLLRIPTFKRQLVGIGVLGFALVGMATFGSLFFEEQFGVGEGGRGLIAAILGTASLLGTLAGGNVGERIFQRSPSRAVRLVGGSIAGFSLVFSVSVFMPNVVLVVLLQWVAIVAVSVCSAPLVTTLAAISQPRLRPLMLSLLGLFVALFGGVLGGVVVGVIADATSLRLGLAALGPIGIIGGLLMARGAATIDADIEAVSREVADDASAPRSGSVSAHMPALAVRNLDFSYDQLQVLFDVSLDIDEGEVVALLGTNGAGKSTLLRAICGLDLPSRGSVRYFGEDVTWVEAERKVRMGMIQVPGGRGTFPSLTVLENLRTGAYTFRGDRARVERGIDEVFGYFPVLADRKDQPAGTLSGGEQQMLALGRAFIAGPRLLMIDELSLGLAPVIVDQLLTIVRAFHQRGTTLVLVEQSVNVALSVATTAYFMERGEVRFGGPAAELLGRDDLLRSVFLEGAEAGLTRGAI